MGGGANFEFPRRVVLDQNAVLVGAGAVGSAVVYCLSHIPGASGRMLVVDNDIFEESNLNRCVTAFSSDIGASKAAVAARYSTDSLTFVPLVAEYEKAARGCRQKFPLVLSAVDNNDARFSIQDDLPETIIHGATGGYVAAISVIDLLKNACLRCMFENSTPRRAGVAGQCGAVQVDAGGGSAEAAVSFVSFFFRAVHGIRGGKAIAAYKGASAAKQAEFSTV